MRLEKGLFRYIKTGEIWFVGRRSGRVLWRNLKVYDLATARKLALLVDDTIIPAKRRPLTFKGGSAGSATPAKTRTRRRRKNQPTEPAKPPENLIPVTTALVAPDVTPLVPVSPCDVPGMVSDTFTTDEAGDYTPLPAVAGKTFAELWAAWKETWTITKSTADTREYRLKMLGKVLDLHTPLRELTLPRLRKLQASLVKGLRPSTVNDIMFKIVH